MTSFHIHNADQPSATLYVKAGAGDRVSMDVQGPERSHAVEVAIGLDAASASELIALLVDRYPVEAAAAVAMNRRSRRLADLRSQMAEATATPGK